MGKWWREQRRGQNGREDEYGNAYEGVDGSENGRGNGSGNRRENEISNINEDGGERKPDNLRSGNRGGSGDVRRQVTPTGTQQPQPQARYPNKTIVS